MKWPGDTAASGTIKVLVADDHQLLREGTREFLDREPDIEVVAEASDGREAVDLAHSLLPDVVIMDISMPRLNGLEATREIKKAHPDIAVLVLTMYDDDQYVFSLLEAGAAGYLLKDIGSTELVQAVRDVFAGELALHPTVARRVLGRFLGREGPDSRVAHELLSPRELEVLTLAAQGLRNRDIAQKLFLSDRTVQAHLSHIFLKLGLGSRTEAIIYGLRHGWFHVDDLL
ncbi:MAG TPA: response regulator transcription factor [Thermoleophilia bacterium]|nr:response regulator transcription factor [Thermoleophilia bacterium]